MKTCPNCNLYFNDGYACPNCGGALYDQDPYAQQTAYPAQDPMQYNPYAAASYDAGYEQPMGYEQPGAYDQQAYGYQQPNYGYAPMQQQTYAPQQQPQQPIFQQPMGAPEPPASPALQTVSAAPAATAAPAKQHHPVRSAILIILALAATAVASILVYETLGSMKGSEPTEVETAIVNSAWTWQANVNGLLDEMEDTMNTLRDTNGVTDASTANDTTADANAAADANANAAPEGEQVTTEQPAGEEGAAEQAAEGAEEAAAALEEAQAEATATEQTEQQDAAEQSFQSDGPFRQLLGYSIALQTLANASQLDAMDQPMQALEETYPGVVVAWNGLRDVMASYNDGIFSSDSNNASTSGASNTEATTDATNTEAASNTSNENAAETANSDLTKWEAFLEEFRAASSNFIQKANEAGFSLG